MSETNFLPKSTLEAVQAKVYSCPSIRKKIEQFYIESGFPGYNPNESLEDNFNSLTSHYLRHAGSMLRFLNEIGKWEGNKNRSTYSNEYWELLTKWYCYEKSVEEQKQYETWLWKLEPQLENVQKNKLRGLLETKVKEDITTVPVFKESSEYALWIIVSVYGGGYFNVVCKAFSSDYITNIPNLAPCFNEEFNSYNELNQKISRIVNNYFTECAGKIPEFPDHVRIIVNVEQMYCLYPEKWDVYYRNKMMGCLAPVTFKLPSIWELNKADRIERQERRNNYTTLGVVGARWINSLDKGLAVQLAKDKQVNLIFCHRKSEDFSIIKDLFEKFPYVLFSRDDIEVETSAYTWMKNCFTSESNDLLGQLRKLREEHLPKDVHPLHSLALVWDLEYPYEEELKSLYVSISPKLGY